MVLKAIPQLPSLDLVQSKTFCEKKLGFLIFTKDDVELHLWLGDNPVVPQNSSAYFRATEIELLYESYERLGIIHPRGHLEDNHGA